MEISLRQKMYLGHFRGVENISFPPHAKLHSSSFPPTYVDRARAVKKVFALVRHLGQEQQLSWLLEILLVVY